MARDKVRVTDLAQMKAEHTPIAMLTAYDFPFARIFDAAGVDVLLVGTAWKWSCREPTVRWR